jgi:ABC-type dipeptide/oligopeptide/nickel transport system permease subunit
MTALPVGTTTLPPVTQVAGRSALRQLLRRPSSVIAWGFLLLVVVLSLAAPVLTPYEPTTQDFAATLLPPGAPGHLAGSDNLGRDQLTRLLYGGRPIMATAVCSVVVSTLVGTLLGMWAGFRRGWLDVVVARGMDVLLSFPLILLAIMIVAALGSGVQNVILAISISQLPVFARLARALTLRESQREYVLAVRAAGFGAPRILFREILPNLVGPVIVQATSTVAVATGLTAALSYLGLGVQPPSPDWGLMVKEAQEFLFDAPDLAIVPGALITLFVLACNFVGDDVRDVLDPGNALTGKAARL